MNIVIVSQCNKRALTETRRILDQFAERKGDRVWHTAITLQGLDTLRKMLRKTARRNTAVCCHWIRRKNHTEVLWIVGNLKKFNEDGTVPTNSTASDVLKAKDENQWHSIEAISLLSGVAGLFHDFGKANALFQRKLKPKTKLRSEPYRHEWISLRLFQAFAGERSDKEWLEHLAQVKAADEVDVLNRLVKDDLKKHPNPFKSLPPLARVVGWLILSHHRLPKYNGDGFEPDLDSMDDWLTHRRILKPQWNSPQCLFDDWADDHRNEVWNFPIGTPMRSATWRTKAASVGSRALRLPGFCETDWLQDKFATHLARLNLMLADHLYSAGESLPQWQDSNYSAAANTDRKTGAIKQRLDEHNIGVAHNAILLSKSLPRLRSTLPSITRHKAFKIRSRDERFRWQDRAFELACSVRVRSENQGFFGVNMASTGCGKTFANARIMYGLANEKLGCRFNVALGLRTLTLQTGDAMRQRLHLNDEDLAVLIGSSAVRELHEQQRALQSSINKTSIEATEEQSGSASSEALFGSHQYVRYDGSLDDGRLGDWLKHSPKLHALLSAPVLVSTIDNLILATEGERGGKQIAPMLRLLTSDLVLDEPDDFGLEDLPALTRLVNWAGMLGSRVLLSSATLPPAIIHALFESYQDGRTVFNASCGESGTNRGVCCAWFDEKSRSQSDHANGDEFAAAHEEFVEKRVRLLEAQPTLRKAEILPVSAIAQDDSSVFDAIASAVSRGMHDLHALNHQTHPETGKRASIGLVRMANIDPMVAVLQTLMVRQPMPDTRIHFICYHSRHPLMVRSAMEAVLDKVLTRHDKDALWSVPEIATALSHADERDNIFVVFATAVAEVGRDHDYDWAIAEPSSMRSIIQLAGRIQRHRQEISDSVNFYILSKNRKALRGDDIAFSRPGFENKEFKLKSHDLTEIISDDQYRDVSAIPRIRESANLSPHDSLVDLEHAHLRKRLFGDKRSDTNAHAAMWWDKNITWSAELQRRMPFRRSQADEEFILLLADDEEELVWNLLQETGELKPAEKSRFKRVELDHHERFRPWVQLDPLTLIIELAEQREMGWADASQKFAGIRLDKLKDSVDSHWHYNADLGVWRALW